MKTLSVAQMREADRRAIEDIGIPAAVLMNNAGAAVFREIKRGPVGIICGKGNNGGDGFVVARLTLLAGLETHVILLANAEELTGDAAVFRDAYLKLGGAIESPQGENQVIATMKRLATYATLVDALLGTGVKGTIHGAMRTAIDAWPDLETIAVDLPSGLNADTGLPCGNAVKATTTVTFQFPKTGFDNPDAKAYVGCLVIADIGIPEICGDDDAWSRLPKRESP